MIKGYRFIASRYKTPVGEIDLIMKRGRMIVFIEVKARQTQRSALESVTQRQKSRIFRAGEHWQSRFGAPDQIYRFDVVAVGGLQMPKHIKNAWDSRL